VRAEEDYRKVSAETFSRFVDLPTSGVVLEVVTR
jgi:hypothetical protein